MSKLLVILTDILPSSRKSGANTMTNNELHSVIDELSEYQIDQIRKIAESYLAMNSELSDTTPKSCPCCKSRTSRFIKKGFSGRKQRYLCKECGRKFTFDTGKVTAFSHQSEEKWFTFLEDTFALKTLDACAEHIGVCHTTAFFMRQKLLSFLEDAVNQTQLLDGMIEADETYIPKGRKGCLLTDRKPRKHGEKAAKRGLSNELACICAAADREGNIVVHCVNSGKPSSEEIKEAIGDRIAEGSVFQCDGEKAYNSLIVEKNCTKIVLNSHKDYNKVYHLNTVNSLHSRLKDVLKHFRGVSTKYLNRYLAFFSVMQLAAQRKDMRSIDYVRILLDDVVDFLPIRCLRSERLLAI